MGRKASVILIFMLALSESTVFAKGPGASVSILRMTHPVLTQRSVPSTMVQYGPVTDVTTRLTPKASMKLDLPNHPILILISP
ncbi:hypothetical protein AB4Y89_13970 [Terriglobus sp. 2YAB30_2]|uniref:hypothetical protein n=1 Tax=unclassified Terriglobus TaxID=2628988 RepID=UPI003F9909F3